MVGYNPAAVAAVVPAATITELNDTTSGIILTGSNLEGTLTMGIPGLASYDVTWKYSGEKMADGSGFIVIQDIAMKLTAVVQSTPIQSRRIILNQSGVYNKFNNRQYAMYQALYGSQWFYDWISRNTASPLFNSTITLPPGSYVLYQNTLTTWTETITLGPIRVVD
jgi:hypothetical protein